MFQGESSADRRSPTRVVVVCWRWERNCKWLLVRLSVKNWMEENIFCTDATACVNFILYFEFTLCLVITSSGLITWFYMQQSHVLFFDITIGYKSLDMLPVVKSPYLINSLGLNCVYKSIKHIKPIQIYQSISSNFHFPKCHLEMAVKVTLWRSSQDLEDQENADWTASMLGWRAKQNSQRTLRTCRKV